MESLIKSDIFFFISSIATVILTILISILLFYLIRTGRNLSLLSEMLKNGLHESGEFGQELKERLEGNMIFRFFFPPLWKKRKVKAKDDRDNDTN